MAALRHFYISYKTDFKMRLRLNKFFFSVQLCTEVSDMELIKRKKPKRKSLIQFNKIKTKNWVNSHKTDK